MTVKMGISFNKFVAGILLAILVASAISIGVSQLVPGPAGPKGDKGDIGAAGVAGAAGPKGDTGDRGAPGATGATGAAGTTGATGSAGTTGPQGPAGLGVTPGSLVTPAYDSGWINITNLAGQNIVVNHNLNNADVTVEVLGRTTASGGVHQKNLGLTEFTGGWSKVYGGQGNDPASGNIVQTSDGGFALAGDTNSFGAGGLDAWLIKTDVVGDLQWNVTYGGILDDSASDMIKTKDGGFALGGYSYSFGAGISDFWLVKINATGGLQWNKTYGDVGNDAALGLVQNSDDSFTLVGSTNSSGAGGMDFWLVKTNSNGLMLWNKTFGGTGDDYGYAIAQTSDGGYALVGSTTSYGAGNTDIWLVKTDGSGNFLWSKTFGGAAAENAYCIVQSSDGGFAIGGVTSSSGAGSSDVYVIKTDTAGTVQWSKTYGGSAGDYGLHIDQTSEGGFIVCGYANSFGAGGSDGYVIKLDSSGNIQWSKLYGGANNEAAYEIIQTSDGGYAVGISTQSFGYGSAVPARRDFWLVRTDKELGLTQIDSTVNSLTLYRGITDAHWNFVRVRIWKTT